MYDYETISIKQRIFLISQGIFHLLLAIFITSTVWLMAYNSDWQTLNTWHVFLSTIGFAFFMAEAVALLNPGNVFVLGCSKPSRGLLHGMLMAFATIAVIAGISIKIHDKTKNNRNHFTSTHGIIGLIAYLLTMFSFIGGLFTAYAKELYKLLNIKPLFLKNCHIFFGIASYILGTVCLCSGLFNYFSEASDATNAGFITILVIYTGINLLGPLKTLFRI